MISVCVYFVSCFLTSYDILANFCRYFHVSFCCCGDFSPQLCGQILCLNLWLLLLLAVGVGAAKALPLENLWYTWTSVFLASKEGNPRVMGCITSSLLESTKHCTYFWEGSYIPAGLELYVAKNDGKLLVLLSTLPRVKVTGVPGPNYLEKWSFQCGTH